MFFFEDGFTVRWEIENFLFYPKHEQFIAKSPEFSLEGSRATYNILMRRHSNTLVVALYRSMLESHYNMKYKLKLKIQSGTTYTEKKLAIFRNNYRIILYNFEADNIDNLFDSRNFLLSCHFWNKSLAQCKNFTSKYIRSYCKAVKVKYDWSPLILNTSPLKELKLDAIIDSSSEIQVTSESEVSINEYQSNILVINMPYRLNDMRYSVLLCNSNGKEISYLKSGSHFIDKFDTLMLKLEGGCEKPIATILPGNKLIMSIDIEVSSGEMITYSEEYKGCYNTFKRGFKMTELIPQIHLRQRFHDTYVNVGHMSFWASGEYLKKISPYFKSLLKNNNILEIPPDVATTDIWLQILYWKKLNEIWSFNCISTLFINSRRLQIISLIRNSSKMVVSALSINNICDVFVMLDVYDDPDVKKRAQQFFNVNVKQILNRNKWKVLLKDYPKLAYKIIHTAFETELCKNNICT